jgi:hypothetical protein
VMSNMLEITSARTPDSLIIHAKVGEYTLPVSPVAVTEAGEAERWRRWWRCLPVVATRAAGTGPAAARLARPVHALYEAFLQPRAQVRQPLSHLSVQGRRAQAFHIWCIIIYASCLSFPAG